MIPTSLYPTSYQISNGTSQQVSNIDSKTLGKDDFLKLLIAQLKNQNPLNPAENTEFIAQLAQFSSLEQMTLMNKNLEKTLENNTVMTEAITNSMMINYFGKTVTADTDTFVYNGDGNVELKFELESMSSGGTLEIYDSEGRVNRSIQLGSMNEGSNHYTWDGVNSYGVKAKTGVYTYKLYLFDSEDNRVKTAQLFSGVVEGISYKDGVAHLNIGGVLVPFTKISTITAE